MLPDMSPSYRVPPATEGGPQNWPVPVKVATVAPVAAETIAMLTAFAHGDHAAGGDGHSADHEAAVGEAVLPDEGTGRRIQGVDGTGTTVVLSPPTYSVVPSYAADA